MADLECSYCNGTGVVRSCTCGLVAYCGKGCQRSDWRRHKSACPPFIARPVPGKGRGLVATRKLSLGLTVIREDPVLVVSRQRPNYDKLLADFLNLSKETRIGILKLYDFVNTAEDLSDQNKMIAKLKRIVEINSIETFEADQEATKNVYLTASLLNHDCKPNLAWHPVQGKIVVNVLRRVEKGEELTVSYFVQSVGTYERGEGCPTFIQRRERLVRYRFDCQCSICLEEGVADDHKRREFQMLDLAQEGTESQGIGELLSIAERKLELAQELDDQVIFLALIDCWKLSQFVADLTDSEDLAVAHQVAQYKAEAAKFAHILGPCAVQAFNKFDCLQLETV
eukprot:GFUD01018969.1.p1 GENE.GFUD01018969.1~~GFUD01018969.1.p1  ORF type:complete len:340 (-),score=124.94 GFUD01018969.1:139-1158(-)